MPRYTQWVARPKMEVLTYIDLSDTALRNVVMQCFIDRRLSVHMHAYVIPTETVIRSLRGHCNAAMARSVILGDGWHSRLGITADEAKPQQRFSSDGKRIGLTYPTIYLVEHYPEGGSDGHTECHLAGWFAVTDLQYSDMVNQDLELVVDFQFNGTYLGAWHAHF